MAKVLMLNSTYETCEQAIDKVFETFPTNINGKRVVLKVNALKGGDPHKYAFTTNYRFLAKVIKKVESLGPKEILIGDSTGTQYYGRSEEVFETSRMKEAAGKYYKNFNKNVTVIQMDRPIKRDLAVLKDVLDADVYIALPKMKTHGMARLSGAVKINFGIIAGAQKVWYHYMTMYPERFAEILVGAHLLRKPDLVIMDAITAMEGYGPASNNTHEVCKIIAGVDCAAIDTAISDMICYEVDDVPTLRICRDRNLGETDISKIEIIGDNKINKQYFLPVEPEATYGCPAFYQEGVGVQYASIEHYRDKVAWRPLIDRQLCAQCQECKKEYLCVKYCPFGALTSSDEGPKLDRDKCHVCCSCMEWCPNHALAMKADPEVIEQLKQYEIDNKYPVFDAKGKRLK